MILFSSILGFFLGSFVASLVLIAFGNHSIPLLCWSAFTFLGCVVCLIIGWNK